MMISLFRAIIGKPKIKILETPRRLVLTAQCVDELETALAPARARRHEGVALLFGLAGDEATLAVASIAPDAETSPGHFFVGKPAMATAIRAAADLGLAVIGQAHTHPKHAHHSEGDIQGLHICYPGFTSLVFPDYGARLPSFNGADILLYGRKKRWARLEPKDVVLMKGP